MGTWEHKCKHEGGDLGEHGGQVCEKWVLGDALGVT